MRYHPIIHVARVGMKFVNDQIGLSINGNQMAIAGIHNKEKVNKRQSKQARREKLNTCATTISSYSWRVSDNDSDINSGDNSEQRNEKQGRSRNKNKEAQRIRNPNQPQRQQTSKNMRTTMKTDDTACEIMHFIIIMLF